MEVRRNMRSRGGIYRWIGVRLVFPVLKEQVAI